MQLAYQQPDSSVVFRAIEASKCASQRLVKWRNKPQQADPCVATTEIELSHSERFGMDQWVVFWKRCSSSLPQQKLSRALVAG